MSIRRACRALPVARATYHYRSRRTGQAQLSERIKEIAATRVRYGYRRIHVLLRREGWVVNPKRVYRIYRELGLQLRNKTPKRRVKAKLRADRQPAVRANETWRWPSSTISLRPGANCVCSRSSIRSAVLPGDRAAVQLSWQRCCGGAGTGRLRGIPEGNPGDQGTEFVSRDLDLWAYQRDVTLDFYRLASQPTMPSSISSTAISERSA